MNNLCKHIFRQDSIIRSISSFGKHSQNVFSTDRHNLKILNLHRKKSIFNGNISSRLGLYAKKLSPINNNSSVHNNSFEIDNSSKIIKGLSYEELIESEPPEDPKAGINLDRGINGVFDIEDLIDVLNRNNAEDIFVASVPNEMKYVDYICVVNGKSQRHMMAIAEFVRKVYKWKRLPSDIIPKVEGEGSKDWIALDLGNIALHIFSKSARIHYDLDSLWSLGPEFDAESKKQDPIVEMLEKHTLYLKNLQPAS